MTRAQRAELPLSTDVAQAVAEHGVCIRPPAMRPDTAGRVIWHKSGPRGVDA
jgi:hypothetical protein